MSPRVSVLTPVYDPPVTVLDEAIESVLAQTFADWELVLVDDASTDPQVRAALDRAERHDSRVRVVRRSRNGGIVTASNDALEAATGELVALLDHDDLLHRDALAWVDAAAADPAVGFVYTDECKVDENGLQSSPFLKPDWSPERFRTQMYTSHLAVFRRSVALEVGGFRDQFEGSQDWDLALRVSEVVDRVAHVPHVLYQWRTIPGSTAADGVEAKPYAYEAATRALQAHCERVGFPATVRHDSDAERSSVYHLDPALDEEPLVSVIIPSNGARREVRGEVSTLLTRCVASIVERTTYPEWEIVLVADRHLQPVVLDEVRDLAGDRLRVVPYDRPFNFSEKINVGAIRARGDHLLLLNDDIEVVTDSWLERLVMYSSFDPIGAVGARLRFADGTIQHAGVVCQEGSPGHVYRGFPADERGYADNVLVAANYLAVTGACLMTRRDVFERVGGLSRGFPLSFNDVDYCLKVWKSGHRVAYDPDTQLYHYESSSRSPDVAAEELALLHQRWSDVIQDDPFLPSGMNRSSVDFVPPVLISDGTIIAHEVAS